MRIAIGGFQHETNTFAPSKATYANFERAKGWPGLQRGGEMLETMVARNLPIAGFIEQMKGTRHQLVPTAWAAAEPSAHVTEDAFERIAAMIVDGIRDAQPDAVYLDLHGAMVTEHLDDGEGEILARVRRTVGEDVPVMASLDLHANVTQKMVDCADALVGYRTYPHVDMADTGGRTAFLLGQRLDGMARPHAALRRIPFLIPLSAQCTDLEPSKALYADLARLETRDVPSLSFTPGFPAADFPECGPVVLAYGMSAGAAARTADALARHIESIEGDFDAPVYAADDAVKRAMAIAAKASRPVVIADTQDNPGAGGDSDTTGMLRALLANNVRRAALGVMVDPAAAEAAHRAGVGSTIELSLGGKSGIARRRAFARAVSRGSALGRPPALQRAVLPGREDGTRALGVPVDRRGEDRPCEQEDPARGPGTVSVRRHRADRTGDPGQQEFGSLSRRFRADRRADPGGQVPGADDRGPERIRVEKAGARHSPETQRAGILKRQGVDPLDAQAIARGLAALGAPLTVEALESCGSTNSELLSREGAQGPALLLTEQQTAGRGRRGRRWHATPGAIMFSLRWEFAGDAARLRGLSLAAGVAIAKTLHALGARGVALKWPNDLLASVGAGGTKLGGILIETRSSPPSSPGRITAVIGVGLNCRRMPGLETRLKRKVASLDEMIDPLPRRNEIIIRIAAELVRTLALFGHAGFEAFRTEWEAMHANQGQPLRVRTAGGRVVAGIADGVGADGGLILRTRRGVRRVHSGTVVRASSMRGSAA